MSEYWSLKEQAAQREREFSILLEVTQNVPVAVELAPLLSQILDQPNVVLDCTGASILELRNRELAS